MILTADTNIIFKSFGEEEGISVIKDAGFDAMDMSLFGMSNNEEYIFSVKEWKENAFKVRKLSDEAGIPFRQSHAPFSFPKEMWDDFDNEIFPKITRAIEIAGILGAKLIVVHPIHFNNYLDGNNMEESFKINMDFYRSLIPYAREAGVKVALENMWYNHPKRKCILAGACGTAADFCKYIDALDSEYIGGVLDLGHCGLIGEEAQDAIRILGHDRIDGLHVHDNDYRTDGHTLPGLGNMDWDEITKALADIRYKGDFTYEAHRFMNSFEDGFKPAALKFAAERGRYLINEIEKQF